jgi:CHAT domain-containing protein
MMTLPPRYRNILSHFACQEFPLRTRQYRVIHLATRGILDEKAPLLSSVLLAHGEQLNVYELMGLHLNADLVVLSACSTARGQITDGDDVIGLTRGLLAAGAKAVLVSLWPVSDLATTLFMGEFFRQLYLAQATPAIDSSYSHSFYWAPFILVG